MRENAGISMDTAGRLKRKYGRMKLHKTGQLKGMVTDFGDFKQDLLEIADFYDHALIAEEGTLKPETAKALESENFRIIWCHFVRLRKISRNIFITC